MSTNQKANEWKPLVDSFNIGGWDPAFFTDDDGKFDMGNGSSNRYPVNMVLNWIASELCNRLELS